MTKRTAFIAGNWKMNLDHQQAIALVQKLAWSLKDAGHDYSTAEVTVFPGFTSIRSVQTLIDADGLELTLGAQDISRHDSGAYTGEVSVSMLRDFGARYCIVGHSERRQYHGESDALVAAKVQRALSAGVTPIVCVGETQAERAAGQTEAVVKRQLAAVIHTNGHCISEIVLAYEPVWAIGTGKTATPQEAQSVHAVLRAQLQAASEHAQRVKILYGGSMNAANASDLLAQADIDGGLIGGAALKPADFLTIIAAAAR